MKHIATQFELAVDDPLRLIGERQEQTPAPKTSPDPEADPEQSFWFGAEIISAYTRKQALADGFQVDVSATAREAGITYPVYLTRAVFDNYVAVPPGVTCQDEAGRLWDIVWMLRHAIRKSQAGAVKIPVALYVRNTNGPARLVSLRATCGPVDMDDARPAITVMMIDED